MKVFVVGSVRYSETYAEKIMVASREVGAALATHHHTVIVGSDSDLDIDPYILEGTNTVLGEHKVTVYCTSQTRTRNPDSTKTPYAQKKSELKNLHISYHKENGPWEVAGITAIRDADAVLLIGGGETTEMVGELAPILGKPVLPIPNFGGASDEIWSRLKALYAQRMTHDERRHIEHGWEGGASAEVVVAFLERLCADNPFRESRPEGETFRILSLSGGGIRGIFQAKYLARTAELLQRELRGCFDLIAGTSTGAIIALGIALGIDANKLVDLFKNHGTEIFPPHIRRQSQHAWSWLMVGPRYDRGPLLQRLTETFGDKQLKDCNPRVLIAAATLNTYRIRRFTTLPHHGADDGELFATDVALSSAAAPLFFPAFTPRRHDVRAYVDGGLWANNPVLMAVMEAHRRLGVPFENMRIVSVGNGEVPAGELAINFNKMRRAKMLSPVLDIMFATQSELAEEAAQFLLKKQGNVLPVNKSMKKFIDLDDSEQAAEILMPLADESAEHHFAHFKRLVGH